jgi:hypothetical protein
MKKALVLCFTNLKNDARVKRQLGFLKPHFKLTTVCLDALPYDDIEVIKVPKLRLTPTRKIALATFLLLGLTKSAHKLMYDYVQYSEKLRAARFDLIVANDIETLPMAFDIASSHTKVYFDAHEYAPRQFEDRLYWRIFFKKFITKLCNQFIPRVDGMSTINKGLADEYEKNFGIKPTVITNAAPYYNLRPHLDVQYPIRLVHHGIFNQSRQPELMIDMMKLLQKEKFTLDLYYLLPENASSQTRQLLDQITTQAAQLGSVRVLPPIKSDEIVETINPKYDIGIILVPPVNFNYENGLPNKLFDCIQARLGMVVGPLKEIASVTQQYNIGIVSPDFTAEAMAGVLSGITLDDVIQYKRSTQRAAEEMNSEINGKIFLASLRSIISAL